MCYYFPKAYVLTGGKRVNNNVFEFFENSDFQQKNLVTPKKMDDKH